MVRTASLHDVTGASRDVLPGSRAPESGQSMLDRPLPLFAGRDQCEVPTDYFRPDFRYLISARMASTSAMIASTPIIPIPVIMAIIPMVVSMWSIIARRSAYKISKDARYGRPHASRVRSALASRQAAVERLHSRWPKRGTSLDLPATGMTTLPASTNRQVKACPRRWKHRVKAHEET